LRGGGCGAGFAVTKRLREPLDPLDCVLCLVYGRLQFLAGDRERQARMLAKAAELVARWPSRTTVFVESYDYLEKLVGVKDLYRDRKNALNKAALEALGALGIDSMSTPELLSLMAAANGVDIPMPGYTPGIEKLLRGLRDRPVWLGISEHDIDRLLEAAERIVVVLDNAGEAVFDIAAAWQLATKYGKPLYMVVRSEPYEVDVTRDEAVGLAAKIAPRAWIISTGGRYPVFHPRAAKEARKLLGHGSLILVKGIANLEAFLDYPETVAHAIFLLRAKCKPLARLFDVGHADPVVVSSTWLLKKVRGRR